MARLIAGLVCAVGVALMVYVTPFRKRERIVGQWAEVTGLFFLGAYLVVLSGSFLLFSYGVI